jgi:hypothetical protein
MPKTAKVEKNMTVLIELDRVREVRFGHKALKKLMSLTGKSLSNITEEEFSMEELERVMYCGLLSDAKEHGETLELEQMEDLLDHAKSFNEVMEAMEKALENAFQSTEKN